VTDRLYFAHILSRSILQEKETVRSWSICKFVYNILNVTFSALFPQMKAQESFDRIKLKAKSLKKKK